MIKAEIVAHSLSPQGDELISVLATFPRIILAEVNTHRMLSKNTSSSRAIPFTKMVESIENNPFIPIAWQRSHSGMQGTEYITDLAEIQGKRLMWLAGRDRAVRTAKDLHEADVTKQLCNRGLETYMWTTMLITGPKSGWDNFFNLRCPNFDGFKSRLEWLAHNPEFMYAKDDSMFFHTINKGQAEIHMMDLAEKIYDAVNESTPIKLNPGDWHIPFADKIGMYSTTNKSDLEELSMKINHTSMAYNEDMEKLAVKISVAMAARTSYTVVGEEKKLDYEALIGLHDRLLSQDPPHSSPLEHCGKAMSNTEYYSFFKGEQSIADENELDIFTDTNKSNPGHGWCNNFKGFIPYRYLVDNKLSM